MDVEKLLESEEFNRMLEQELEKVHKEVDDAVMNAMVSAVTEALGK